MIHLIKRVTASFFSKQPKLYHISFGPNKGMKLFTSFAISPRMLFGFDETWVAKMASRHIAKDDVVYDIGAHIGYTSLLFVKLVGANGQVHAFELLPSVAEKYLKKTIQANELSHLISVHPIGLSSKAEQIDIYVGETMMGTLDRSGYESKNVERCKIETLDQYLVESGIKPPSLIKVDIERAEVEFLKGARSTIARFKPVLIIEFHNADLLREGYRLLDVLNYTVVAENGKVDEAYLDSLTSFYGNIVATAKG